MQENKDPRKIISHKNWTQKKDWTLFIHGGMSRDLLSKLEENRFDDVLSAIAEHIKNHEVVPSDLFKEYNTLILKVKKNVD